MLKKNLLAAASMALGMTLSSAAFAETQITWWHAMGGALGEAVNEIATDFNASQNEFKITPVFKGTYEETLTAAIAAFRAGEQPNVMQVFDAGAATVIGAARCATIPVQDLLQDNGVDFNIEDYIARRALLLRRHRRQDDRHAVQLLDPGPLLQCGRAFDRRLASMRLRRPMNSLRA
ncbi:MAG: hypothetical protein HoeaKO_16770 [Hoeflea alexandrii]